MATLRVLSSVDDIGAAEWNAAVDRLGGSIHHRHEWLRALERGGAVDVEPRHAVLMDGGRVTALVPCYRTRRCPKLEMFLRYYVSSPLAGAPLPVVHSMYGQTSEVLAGSAADAERLVTELERLAAADPEPAPLTFPLVPADAPLLPLLAARGYATGLLSCTNLLAVRWSTFADYLADRPSAKRRNILRGLRRSEQAGVAVAVRRGAEAADLDLLAELTAATARHHGSPLFFDRRFLTAIATELAAAVVMFTVRAAGAVLLSCLAVEHAGELTPWCVGLDYAGLDRFDHYNYLYAALIRHAIESGLSTVNFGRSTYVIKRKFGCRQRPVYAAVGGLGTPASGAAEWIAATDRHARAELAAVGLPQPAGRAA